MIHAPIPEQTPCREHDHARHMKPRQWVSAGVTLVILGGVVIATLGGVIFDEHSPSDQRAALIRTLAAVAIIVGALIIVGGCVAAHVNARIDAAIEQFAAKFLAEDATPTQIIPAQRQVVYAGTASVGSAAEDVQDEERWRWYAKGVRDVCAAPESGLADVVKMPVSRNGRSS